MVELWMVEFQVAFFYSFFHCLSLDLKEIT